MLARRRPAYFVFHGRYVPREDWRVFWRGDLAHVLPNVLVGSNVQPCDLHPLEVRCLADIRAYEEL